MLPPSLRSLLVCALLSLPSAAHATWIESGDVVLIARQADTGFTTPVYVEAAQVNVEDEMELVQVGLMAPGEVTVVGEGDFGDRKVLGDFYVYEGTANIQSVVGTLSPGTVEIGSGTELDPRIGVLNLLGSDLEDTSEFDVGRGSTLNLNSSRIGFVEVFEDAFLYASFGARLVNLRTHADSFSSLVGSLLVSDSNCQFFGTLVFEDSFVQCRNLLIANPGGDSTTVDLRVLAGAAFDFTVVQTFEMYGGDVDIANAVATTNELIVGSVDSDLDISSSLWTNTGGTQLEAGGTVGPVEMALVNGTRFHELDDVHVSGHPAWQHLRVDGATSELEVDGDLRIGRYLDFRDRPQDFTGNMTVSNGAVVIVDGTLVVRPQGVLTIESGATVYAATVENLGTITENGGTLVVPEAGGTLAGLAALSVCAWRARSRRS